MEGDGEILDGGQVIDTGLEPGAVDEGLETLPGADDGTPTEGTGEPAPEPWREAIGEAISGLTAEVRQTLEDIGRRTDSRFDDMSRRFSQPQPTPKREPQQHEWDADPLKFVEAGADPQMVRYFQAQRAGNQALVDQIKELQNRIDRSEESSRKRREGDEMAAHFRGQINTALKANDLSDDAEKIDQFVQPMVMGLALLAEGGDPRRADVGGAIKNFNAYVTERIEREIKRRTDAGTLQAGTPRPPPSGQGTRPTIKRREIKNMQDAEKAIDDLFERWPEQEGPPE